MTLLEALSAVTGTAAAALAAAYSVITLIAVLSWKLRPAPPNASGLPAVTVLKPLCGNEPLLYERLRSFCLQSHPHFQLILGVRDADDPALVVARRLAAEFPRLPINIVVSARQHGSNCKISNLINMMEQAKHEVLVIADSDTQVGPDYLVAVTAPLRDATVGLVTCLYRGVPTPGLWSCLGAMYNNEWYVPSVLLAHLFGYRGYCFGQTICLRRDTLMRIGGLAAVADHLADDYKLGELVRGTGQRIELSTYMLDAQHDEYSLRSLFHHELRWMRTTRVLRPVSACFLFFSFSMPLSLLGTVLASAQPAFLPIAWYCSSVAILARLALHIAQSSSLLPGRRPPFWLVPLRDLLTCVVWLRSFHSFRVSWRGNQFAVGADGVMRRVG